MKNTTKTGYVICTNTKHKKRYEVNESKKQPGFAICPACGEYHEIVKEN